MAKAYWINLFRSVNDPEKLSSYVELAGPVMAEFGGRFLARGMPTRVFEFGVMERTIVIEFDSIAHAVAAYESPPTNTPSLCSAMGPNPISASSRPSREPHTGRCGVGHARPTITPNVVQTAAATASRSASLDECRVRGAYPFAGPRSSSLDVRT